VPCAEAVHKFGHAATLLEDITHIGARKPSFSEAKEAKRLFSRFLGAATPLALHHETKVFWFFFQKRTIFFPLPFDEREIGEAVHGIADT